MVLDYKQDYVVIVTVAYVADVKRMQSLTRANSLDSDMEKA